MAGKKPLKDQAHVRLYRHELESAAYRSLTPDARALLVEFRSLYAGRSNRIHLSLREAMRRLGVGRRRAQSAIDDLQDRGFIRLLAPGSFSTKTVSAVRSSRSKRSLPRSVATSMVIGRRYIGW